MKVLDSRERLEATLAHELCHAAAWLLDRTAKPPHGQVPRRHHPRSPCPRCLRALARPLSPSQCARLLAGQPVIYVASSPTGCGRRFPDGGLRSTPAP